MWELDCEESWLLKNWDFWTVVFEKTPESPLDCKEIQPVHFKGNQFWIFIGRTDAEAEILALWPPDAKNWFIWKDPDAGKDWRWKEKGTTEDEMVGWHHQFNGHEYEWAPGVGDGQRGLACYSPWGRKELDMTERLNWTEPERMKKLGQSRNDVQLWMCLVMMVKSDAVRNNTAQNAGMLGPWIKVNWTRWSRRWEQ